MQGRRTGIPPTRQLRRARFQTTMISSSQSRLHVEYTICTVKARRARSSQAKGLSKQSRTKLVQNFEARTLTRAVLGMASITEVYRSFTIFIRQNSMREVVEDDVEDVAVSRRRRQKSRGRGTSKIQQQSQGFSIHWRLHLNLE